MKTIKQPMRAVLLATLTGLLCMINMPAVAKTPQPSGLFSSSSEDAKANLPRHALKGKSRKVRINHRKLREGRFFVSLPDGVSYEAIRDLKQDQNKGRYAWVGHAGDDRRNRVVIGVSGDAVAGTFSYNGKLFRLEPRANGEHVLSEVLPTDPAPELDPIPVSDTPLVTSDTSDYIAAAADTNGAVIDVLVAYTTAVVSRYGTSGAEALALQAVAEANQAYANSGMKLRLNLVHSTHTSYTESGNMTTDLSRLRTANDGYMDEIHTLRDQYGADLVSLIEDEPAYCGLAYRMATLSASFASSAFSVVHHGCATGYYSFAHELGHNQGAHHDTGNASGSALFSYAYGYQDPNASFRTIMAYNCPGGCTRVSHFSNSNVLYNGRPTGYPYYTENAYALENSAAVVASFRQATREVVPASPIDLSSVATGPNQADLTWTDTSDNEKGFLLERSSDGLNYTQIASLAANSKSYRDTELVADALYYYRARAWNSAGNSGYSNVSTAATDPAPQYFDQFAQGEFRTASTVSGSLADTMARDNRFESITEADSPGYRRQRYSYLEHYWAFNVQAGESITVNAEVTTDSDAQTFTFAYSTTPVSLDLNPEAWVDMFTVSAQTSDPLQFNLPANLSGTVYISVRDNKRKKGVATADTLNVDYLAIRTSTTGSAGDNGSSTATEPLDLIASGTQGKVRQKIALTWTGAASASVDIFRDGVLVHAAVNNDGDYRDKIESTTAATYTYEVCETGTNTCSNAVVVSF